MRRIVSPFYRSRRPGLPSTPSAPSHTRICPVLKRRSITFTRAKHKGPKYINFAPRPETGIGYAISDPSNLNIQMFSFFCGSLWLSLLVLISFPHVPLRLWLCFSSDLFPCYVTIVFVRCISIQRNAAEVRLLSWAILHDVCSISDTG